jgi:hypothetical protein
MNPDGRSESVKERKDIIMAGKAGKFKTVLGVALVLLAVAALLFWEAEGREMLLMDSVLVAEGDIKKGEEVAASLFNVVSVPSGAIIDGAITPAERKQLESTEAATDIVKGAQLSWRHLRDKDAKPKPDISCFVIRNEWISMCTSSLRRGDDVLIVSADGEDIIGRYPVSYVKDGDGREVSEASSGMYSFVVEDGGNDRVNTSAPIHHVEIACELSDYRRILDYCDGKAGASLMLVRKEAAA